MLDEASGDAIDHLRLEIDDGNRIHHLGSAFQGGVYSHVHKDLRRVLGRAVLDPWSRAYCGDGVLADCREALWDALSAAAADLEAEFGSASVADWKRQIADEDVRHTAAGVTAVPAIHWINRPTFQQVVQIESGDAYKCYRAKNRAAFAQRTVSLADEIESKSTVVLGPEALCNPVDVNGEGIDDATAHLECYRIKDAAGQATFAPRVVTVADRFGARDVVLAKPRRLCVPTSKDGVASALRLDAVKCYPATRVLPRLERSGVHLADQFESKDAEVLRPDSVCVPVDVDGSGADDATSGLTCYRVRSRPKFAGRDVTTDNVFGSGAVRATKAVRLCVPSVRP
jgi:hypothetical protein